MDHQPSSIKFAAIGHQENWDKVLRFVNAIRDLKEINKLSAEQVKEVYAFIPPRTLFDVDMYSSKTGCCKGVYIETFIPPDELDMRHLRANVVKVKEACAHAARLKIPVVSLGGFTSIILEAGGAGLHNIGDTHFTTGNTLTAAFIVKAVEKACRWWDISLQASTVMIIGSTGDIGSACTIYFAEKCHELILCARQKAALEEQALSLLSKKVNVNWSVDINKFLPFADIVICVASSLLESNEPLQFSPQAIICDAGYPKNLSHSITHHGQRIFSGGMGMVEKGFHFHPDYAEETYRFPVSNIAHGCLLEAIVLAMEDTPMSYSSGRGNITLDAMDNILGVAASHGVHPAPLFNAVTAWEKKYHKNLHHESS